ncbi:protein maternal effect lethal 26-like [Bradysia coprophila]|uniref:protein maternal effect lethal 26-like n=1 Tax=Bradysia coprophila TaxID=38358 RepID=UPI00187D7516|nr:protein maternal effect lethal 26-like [Bradysia coprophila]
MLRRNRHANPHPQSNAASVECVPQPPQRMITKATSREEFSDVQFTVDGKVIVAHRIILADRSEVFRTMFMWNHNSAKTGPIAIAETTYDAFFNFINAIYYGNTPADPELCLEMIKLAEKYDVQDIKMEAEASVIASITMQNAIDILITSKVHRADRIKKAALEFCARNNVHEMPNSKNLANFPDLMIEVFEQISLTKRNVNNTTFIGNSRGGNH